MLLKRVVVFRKKIPLSIFAINKVDFLSEIFPENFVEKYILPDQPPIFALKNQ